MIIAFADLARGTTTRVGNRTNAIGRCGGGRFKRKVWLFYVGV
jgi:hypothetical protein